MIKENKWKVIISSAIILLPIFVGLILWDRLPDRIATHWNASGTADGWSNKTFAVFALPMIIFVIHWICLLFTNADTKNKGQSPKIFNIVLFITPAISLLVSFIIYAEALGANVSVESIMPVFLGLMFIVIGNYLPKCKQNHTIGIKVPWTYSSEENWNKTHRMGGIMYVAGGTIMVLSVFLPTNMDVFTMIFLLIIMAVAPIIYSYVLYIKQKKR